MSKNKRRKKVNPVANRMKNQAQLPARAIEPSSAETIASQNVADTLAILIEPEPEPLATSAEVAEPEQLVTVDEPTFKENQSPATSNEPQSTSSFEVSESDEPDPLDFAVKFPVTTRPVIGQVLETDSMQLLIRGYGPK